MHHAAMLIIFSRCVLIRAVATGMLTANNTSIVLSIPYGVLEPIVICDTVEHPEFPDPLSPHTGDRCNSSSAAE